MGNSISLHNKRKLRNRKALKSKSYGKLRLSVFRSSRHIYGQIIDDVQGITIAAASSPVSYTHLTLPTKRIV